MPEEIKNATEEMVEQMIDEKVVDPGTKELVVLLAFAFSAGAVAGGTVMPKAKEAVKGLWTSFTGLFCRKKETEEVTEE